MRMHYVERGSYRDPQFTSGRKVTFGEILTLSDLDLEGRYFSSECYTFERVKRRKFRIKCDGAASTAPAVTEVAGVTLFINQRGDIWAGDGSDDGNALDLAVPMMGPEWRQTSCTCTDSRLTSASFLLSTKFFRLHDDEVGSRRDGPSGVVAYAPFPPICTSTP